MTLSDKKPSKSLAQRTLSGLNWKFFSVVVQSLLTFVVGIVLARFIPPKDFGLLGMAIIFIGMAELFSTLGMGPAVIQRQSLSKAHIRVALTLTTILGLAITLVLWTSANAIALFFGNSQIALIVKVISLSFLFNGLSSTSRSLLRRGLQFRKIFFIEMAANIFGYSTFAVPMAILGFGVWSLVIGIFVSTIISSLLFLLMAKPSLMPLLRRKEICELIGFGSGITFINMLNYAATNIDYFIIGKILSARDLGLYTRAYQIMLLPISRFSKALTTVLFPAYAEIQNEKGRISKAYFKAVNATAIVAFPIMVAMAISAKYIVVGLYGPNWSGAATSLRILCFAGMLKAIFHLAGSVVQATGKIYSEVRRQFVYLLVVIGGSLLGVRYGIEGVAVAIILASLWLYVSMAHLVLNILENKWGDFFSAQLPGFAIASMVGTVDLLLINALEFLLPEKMILLKLLCLIAASAGSLLLSLVFMPKKLKGEMPGWMADNYSNFLPKTFRTWIIRHV